MELLEVILTESWDLLLPWLVAPADHGEAEWYLTVSERYTAMSLRKLFNDVAFRFHYSGQNRLHVI